METRSALAQLIELLAEKGITETRDLVKRTGYSAPRIRAAKAELAACPQAPTRLPASACPQAPRSPASDHLSNNREDTRRNSFSEPRPPSAEKKVQVEGSVALAASEERAAPKRAAEGAMAAALVANDPSRNAARLLPDGTIWLADEERAHWLPKFGSAEALDLALLQAAAFVKPHGMHCLAVQVNAQLAKQIADRRNQDQRYQAAKKTPGAWSKIGVPPAATESLEAFKRRMASRGLVQGGV